MRTILFLDYTGVLRCGRCSADSCGHLRKLARIVRTLGCDIVLSTSYKYDMSFIEELRQRFTEHGIPEWIGVTPHLQDVRWYEIKGWIEEHGAAGDRLVIVDDRHDADLTAYVPDTYRDCHFFRADPRVGLDGNLMQAVLRLAAAT